MALWPFKSAIEKHVDSVIEEHIFEQVAREIHANEIRPGLWAKAFAACNGDQERTRAKYISLRAAGLVKEIEAHHELLSTTATQQSDPPEVQSNATTVFRTIICPSCLTAFRRRDSGELECHCPLCKTRFLVNSGNRLK